MEAFGLAAIQQTTNKLYAKIFEPVLQQYDLTQVDVEMLLFVADNPQCNTAQEIVRSRQFSKSHVVTSLEKLHSRGYVGLVPTEENPKIRRIKIQSAASELIVKSRMCQMECMEFMFDGLSDAEKRQLNSTLEKMVGNAKKAYRDLSRRVGFGV